MPHARQIPELNESDLRRFLDKIEVQSFTRPGLIGPCWIWIGEIGSEGYGRFGKLTDSGWQKYPAHRVAFVIWNSSILPDLDPDHLCHVRNCIAPDHLEAVTNCINILRGNGLCAQNARKDRCPQGHFYTHKDKNGGRKCRPCLRLSNQRYKKRKRQCLR